MNKYLFLDVETGGLGQDKSLLTCYMAVTDATLDVLDELDLRVKPDDDIYVVSGSSLGIHGINLVEHDKLAKPYKEVRPLVYNFLAKHAMAGPGNLTPVGQNVAFDCRWVKDRIISGGAWDSFVSYRCLDLASVRNFLVLTNRLPEDFPESLQDIAGHFGLKHEAHTARGDALVGIEILRRFIQC